jgi:hypothetical protein
VLEAGMMITIPLSLDQEGDDDLSVQNMFHAQGLGGVFSAPMSP